MKEREFEKLILESMKDLSLEDQEKLLNNIEDKWLPKIKEKFIKKTKKHTKCFNCGKYSLTKDFKEIYEQVENKGQVVYIDSGYGDDDEFADVTYSVCFSICPICKAKKEKSRMFLFEKNRHGRL